MNISNCESFTEANSRNDVTIYITRRYEPVAIYPQAMPVLRNSQYRAQLEVPEKYYHSVEYPFWQLDFLISPASNSREYKMDFCTEQLNRELFYLSVCHIYRIHQAKQWKPQLQSESNHFLHSVSESPTYMYGVVLCEPIQPMKSLVTNRNYVKNFTRPIETCNTFGYRSINNVMTILIGEQICRSLLGLLQFFCSKNVTVNRN